MSRAGPLDNTIEIVTPENIAFHYRLAGPYRRLFAYGLDFLIRVVLLVAFVFGLSPVIQLLQGPGQATIIILIFLLEWFYGGLFETYMNGQTPGKRILGLRTLTLDGQPINGLQAVLRNILRAADTMPWIPTGLGPPIDVIPTCILGLACMSLNHRYQRLGDLVCGTMVVVEERRWFSGMARIEDARAAKLAALLPADLVISRTLARAIATYVERRKNFTLARRREIARHLGEPLVERLGLASDTSHDLLLCALYHRAFLADHGAQEEQTASAGATSKNKSVGGPV